MLFPTWKDMEILLTKRFINWESFSIEDFTKLDQVLKIKIRHKF